MSRAKAIGWWERGYGMDGNEYRCIGCGPLEYPITESMREHYPEGLCCDICDVIIVEMNPQHCWECRVNHPADIIIIDNQCPKHRRENEEE